MRTNYVEMHIYRQLFCIFNVNRSVCEKRPNIDF